MWNMGISIRWSLLLYKKINQKKKTNGEGRKGFIQSDSGWLRLHHWFTQGGHWMIRCCLGPGIWCTGCYMWVDTEEWGYHLCSPQFQYRFHLWGSIPVLLFFDLPSLRLLSCSQLLYSLAQLFSLTSRALLLQHTLHWVDWSGFLFPLGQDLISDTHSGLCLLQNILHF